MAFPVLWAAFVIVAVLGSSYIITRDLLIGCYRLVRYGKAQAPNG